MEGVLSRPFRLSARSCVVVVLAALVAGCASESVPGNPQTGLVRFELQ